MLNYIRNHFHPLWRLRRLAWYRALQKRLDFPVLIKNGPVHFWVMFLRDFTYVAPIKGGEEGERVVFDKIMRSVDITHVFDVGANVGSYAWHALGIKPDTNVYLFEPDPTNIRLLKKTIQLNRFTRVQLWPGVLSSSKNPRDFIVDEVSGATGSLGHTITTPSLLHAQYGMTRKIAVPSTTLDSYAAAVFGAKYVLLKIDTEGSELEILEGSSAFIKKFRPLIIIECFDTQNLEPLLAENYTVHTLSENHNHLLLPVEWVDVFRKKEILNGQLRPRKQNHRPS